MAVRTPIFFQKKTTTQTELRRSDPHFFEGAGSFIAPVSNLLTNSEFREHRMKLDIYFWLGRDQIPFLIGEGGEHRPRICSRWVGLSFKGKCF